jgi:hypothetical protein
MKASPCYHNRQARFTPVWQRALSQIENTTNSLIEQLPKNSELINSAWRTMLLTMCLGKSAPLVIGNRNGSGLGGCLRWMCEPDCSFIEKPPFCKARIATRGLRPRILAASRPGP